MPAPWHRAELAYCSNVHPGESLDALLANVAGPIRAVRERRGLQRMDAGLWVAAEAAADGSTTTRLAAALDRAGIDLTTLNAFPHGGFHATRVKKAVYRPDWSEPERLDYTLACARLLAALQPPGRGEGTLSTLPLGYAEEWDAARTAAAAEALCRAAQALAGIEETSGRSLRLCLEPEPGCVIETSAQVTAFFASALPAAAARTGTPADLVARHLGVCIDICHQAVQFEDLAVSLAQLADAGIAIGKIQLSSALEVHDPSHPITRVVLNDFAEPRYLHQVRAPGAEGTLLASDDLEDALTDPHLATSAPWRIHYHVPLQATRVGRKRLGTTLAAVERAIAWLATRDDCRPQLEVETYTWEVLPERERGDEATWLVDGIAAELAWVEAALARRGLLLANP